MSNVLLGSRLGISLGIEVGLIVGAIVTGLSVGAIETGLSVGACRQPKKHLVDRLMQTNITRILLFDLLLLGSSLLASLEIRDTVSQDTGANGQHEIRLFSLHSLEFS